jgi:hypothetical protein
MKLITVISFALITSLAVLSQPTQHTETSQSPRIEISYDAAKNRTLVRLMPLQISGEKQKYHSLHISPSFSYEGQTPAKPEFIEFELQTVVKGRLRTDLYVVFIVDGETIFLSSNRWAVKRPVPGRVWMGERLVFPMPFDTLLRLARAKRVAVKLDGIVFDFYENHKTALKMFAKEIGGG